MTSVDRLAESGLSSSPSSDDIDVIKDSTQRHVGQRKRLATLYDAVAGNLYHDRQDGDSTELSDKGSSDPEPDAGSRGAAAADTSRKKPGLIKHTTRHVPYAPEEVLFRRKDAPQRYAEHDIYFAHERDLPDRSVLPDSDLLKAMHGYASRFYAAKRQAAPQLQSDDANPETANAGRQPGTAVKNHSQESVDEHSMDETALLAFGFLLEEAGRDVLGRRGDMVFTEGMDDAANDHAASESGPLTRAALHTSVGSSSSGGDTEDSTPERDIKRRKTRTR